MYIALQYHHSKHPISLHIFACQYHSARSIAPAIGDVILSDG